MSNRYEKSTLKYCLFNPEAILLYSVSILTIVRSFLPLITNREQKINILILCRKKRSFVRI